MSVLPLVFALVAAILAIIALVQTRGASVVAWAALFVAIAVALLAR